jgi:hypothetical protein
MYHPKMLEKARTMKDFTKEKFGYMSDIGVVKGNMLTWDMAVFEKKKGNNYEMHQFYFTEHIFPVSTVEKEMKKHFNILEKLDSDTMKRPTANTTRLLYVARKKD